MINESKTLSGFIFYFLKKQWLGFIVLFITMSCWALQESVYPYFIKLIVDGVSNFQGDKSQIFTHLKTTLIYGLIAALVIEANFRLYDFVSAHFYPRLMANIRSSMFEYIIHHSHNYFVENFAGTLASRIGRLPEGIYRIIDLIITTFFPVILAFIISSIFLIQSNPLFGFIVIIWLATHITITFAFASKSKEYSAEHSNRLTKLHGKIVDCLANIVNVRLFARHKYEIKYFAKYQQQEIDSYAKSMSYNAVMRLLLGASSMIFLCSMVGGAIYFYKQGTISVGDVALILSYHSLVGLAWYMGMEIITIFELIGNCNEAMKILKKPYEVIDAPNAKDLLVSQGKIELVDVGFHYSRNRNIFNNVSLTIEAKQKVGLVGFSGSGKTTFVNLLLRYFNLSSGKILIDDQDIAEVTQKSLRESIALIPQDPILFHRTLIENLRYGNLEANDEEVIEAAKQAHAEEFISHLKAGYYTMVGERGMKLSGGQRQRIAIARAILKNAPILILDEATSALDSATEELIQESLKTMVENKTVIIIAHRLSTLLSMDRILVFDQGNVVEDGTHEELLAKGGHYAKLWQKQSGGFLPNTVSND